MAYTAQPPLPSTSKFSPSVSTSEPRLCFCASPICSTIPEGYDMRNCGPADAMIGHATTAAVQSGLGRTGSNSPADCCPSADDDRSHSHVAAAHRLDKQYINSRCNSSSMRYLLYRTEQSYVTAEQQQCFIRQHTLIHSQNCTAADTALKQHQLLLLQRQQAAAAEATAAAEKPQQQSMSLYGNYYRTAAGQHGGSSTSAPVDDCHAGHFPASSISQRHAAKGAARLPPPTAASTCHSQQPQHSTHPADCYTLASHRHHAVPILQQQADQQHSVFTTSCSSCASAGTAYAAPAPAASLMGRWSGQVAVLDASAFPELCDADNCHSDFSLECEEALLSLGATDAYTYHVKTSQTSPVIGRDNSSCMQPSQRTINCNVEVNAMLANDSDMLAHIQDSGSSQGQLPSVDQEEIDMDEDQRQEHITCTIGNSKGQAEPASLAADHQKLARYQAATQVLEVVAAKRDPQRKGQLVLTATNATAVAAGSESARPRLLVTEVSVYMNCAANSQMALDQANRLMGKMRLPGNVQYMPVSPDSFLFKAGAAWQFPAFVICLGSSYLQRMLARLPQLADAVLACPGFEDYAECLSDQPVIPPHRLSGPEAVATLATLRSIQFTCLYLATKIADQIHALGLLRFMLTNLSHTGAMVTSQQAGNVEASCLEALEWRLGPFFIDDELTGDDEVLWAQSMGHFDYGTERDSYPETF